MTSPSETRIMLAILARLNALPKCHFARANTGMASAGSGRFIRFGERGQADIIGVADGWYVGVEVKTETGKQSDDQKKWQAKIEAAGGVYVLARSIDEGVTPVAALLRGPRCSQ